MKALKEMNNVEKGHLLARLFPDNLKELTQFAQQETGRFRKHEQYVRSIWTDPLITEDFWYGLVSDIESTIRRQKVSLHRSARVFSDQLFDGYNAIFTVHCLMKYADREECTHQLRQVIHLLFGHDKLIEITLNE